ncbi:MAG: M20/M25/M40 family metallo-hydrolase [Bacteroidota bacterium]|nr:M20/M25/M40 family metallo-hydrolase [Bacteroidota bacterium]
MKKIILTFLFSCSISGAFAQSPTIIQKDPQIDQMVKEISADSLQSYVRGLVSFGTRHTLSSQNDPKRGVGAAKKWVLRKFNQFAKNSGGRLTAIIDSTTYQPDGKRVPAAINLGNVVATLKGTDPKDNRIFLITGHMDSRRSDVMDATGDSPGANDDGSGTAAVMECARVMSKHSFPATIIFVAVTGEEQGLIGARYLAEKAKKANWNIVAVLNNDIIGSNHSNGTNIINNTQVRIFSEGMPAYELEKNAAGIRQYGLENDGSARQLARYMKEVGERYVDNLEVKLIYRNDRFGRGGDHTPFVENGFAAVRVTEMNENFYFQHQDVRTENNIKYGDLIENMDFEYLRKNTAMNLANLASLAKAPAMPQDVTYKSEEVPNSTSISWKQPVSGKPTGYYLLIRETTSPFWQKKVFTSATEINVPYTKDNYLFAVQSVGSNGNESLPVVPKVVPRQPQQAQAQPTQNQPASQSAENKGKARQGKK